MTNATKPNRLARVVRLTSLVAQLQIHQVETQRLRGWKQIRAIWRFWRVSVEFDRLSKELEREIPSARVVR